jgi:ArsR family transcriptional regulator
MTTVPCLEQLTKALADQTRVRLLLLLTDKRTELCVCELTQALDLAQPKISRHLAILRECNLLLDRKAGLWVYYRLHPDLPCWALDALDSLRLGSEHIEPYQTDRRRLAHAERLNPSCITTDCC